MISFELNSNINLNKFLSSLRVITLAESLGGVESLISHPASMTHASYPKEYRNKIGITDNLIRLSVGIEHYTDLIQDIEFAIKESKQ
jgi:cystathionine beta-lyase